MPRFENGPLVPELPALSPVVILRILGGLAALLGCGPLDDRVPSIVAPAAMEGSEPSVAGAGGSGEQRGVPVGNEAGASGAAMNAAGEPPAGDPPVGDASTGGSTGEAAS